MSKSMPTNLITELFPLKVQTTKIYTEETDHLNRAVSIKETELIINNLKTTTTTKHHAQMVLLVNFTKYLRNYTSLH